MQFRVFAQCTVLPLGDHGKMKRETNGSIITSASWVGAPEQLLFSLGGGTGGKLFPLSSGSKSLLLTLFTRHVVSLPLPHPQSLACISRKRILLPNAVHSISGNNEKKEISIDPELQTHVSLAAGLWTGYIIWPEP